MGLLPKNEAILGDLEEYARLLLRAAEREAGPRGSQPPSNDDAHALAVRILGALRTTFLTPLDRDDLFTLARALEATLVSIDRAAFDWSLAGERPADFLKDDASGGALRLLVEAVSLLSDENKHDRAREACVSVLALERDARRAEWTALAGEDARPAHAWLRFRAHEATARVAETCARAAEDILRALLDS